MNRTNITTLRQRRRGSIVPIVALSMLVIMAGIALVLDRGWIDTAQVELMTAAEAAALAGVGELVDDDLLRPNARTSRRIARAKNAAVRIAAQNHVAGEPVFLQTGSGGDVRIGRIAVSDTTGDMMFLETNHDPLTVVVTAHLRRSRGNPVALLMRQVSGQPAADVSRLVEATADNHVVGVRALAGIAVPALPLAILSADATGRRPDTWQQQIIKRAGADQFGFDSATGQVTRGPDGIPEIVLCAADPDDATAVPNLRLIKIGDSDRGRGCVQQILTGWTVDDLDRFDGELRLPARPVEMAATATLSGGECDALGEMLGQCRICLLYAEALGANGQPAPDRARCVGLVAGRVMQVTRQPHGAPRIVFQPAVITTRTAILATDTSVTNAGPARSETTQPAPVNEYIYKLSLSQ